MTGAELISTYPWDRGFVSVRPMRQHGFFVCIRGVGSSLRCITEVYPLSLFSFFGGPNPPSGLSPSGRPLLTGRPALFVNSPLEV